MKHLTDILQLTGERLDAALSNSRVSISRQDKDLNYLIIINPHPDYDKAPKPPQRASGYMSSDEADRLDGLKREVITTGKGKRTMMKLKFSDGVRTYDLTVEPLRDDTGEIIGVETISVDLTDLIAAQQALAHANDQLIKLLDQALGVETDPR